MIDFEYLYKGLCGLARARRANTLAGHLGAAVVAGYFFGEDNPNLDAQVYVAVTRELDRIIAGDESLWFDPEKAGVTVAELFAPFPEEKADESQIPLIAQALAGNIGKTRQSGHNVIFAAIATRALMGHPQFATPSIVDGLRELIAGFNGAGPGRGYYGKQRGWLAGDQVDLSAVERLTNYDSEQAMAEVVIDDLILWGGARKQGFGGMFHLINHAAGLIELARYGQADVARRGWAAHQRHVRLWRSLPRLDEELGKITPAEYDPRTAAYWRRESDTPYSARLTHRVKTLYGFYTLLPYVQSAEKRRRAKKKFLYLMA